MQQLHNPNYKINRFKFLLILFINFASTFHFAHAQSSEDTPEDTLTKIATAAARVEVLPHLCGMFYLVDKKLTNEFSVAMVAEGTARFGSEVFRPSFTQAMYNFYAEANDKGAATWCTEQREWYKRIGMPFLIGKNIR